MNLTCDEGKLFYDLYAALLSFVNRKLKVSSEQFADAQEYMSTPPEARLAIRDALFAQRELIDVFVKENPGSLPPDQLEVVRSWKHAVVGKFYIFRHLALYTVFLTSGGSPNKAYGVLGLADPLEEVNEEYAELCRKLATALARKRPSPLLQGRLETWACGIVRTIGWVNYLDDRSRKRHMRLPFIDEAFGVAESTGQGKSKAIRTMFKIRNFDPRWTLPSKMDDNPMVWTLELNGFLMDIRHAPRELQEAAFTKGLIPYIPADRAGAGE